MKVDIGDEEDSPEGRDGTSDVDEVPIVARPDERSDDARSATNIAMWRTYLPERCIETMIAMGWDRTT